MSRIIGRRNNKSRFYVIVCLAVVVLVGLILGAFDVFGSRTRIGGVDYLLELDYQCESEFVEATYYQSDCEYLLSQQGENLNDGNGDTEDISEDEEDYSSDHLLGYYPWIWEVEAEVVDVERPHLAHGGTRINILSWDESIVQIEFASVALDTSVGTWPIGTQRSWQYAGPFVNNSTPCAQLVEDGDIVLPALDSFMLDNPDSADSKAVVVTVPWSEPTDSDSDTEEEASYCVELRYIPSDSTDEQSLWLEFKLPIDDFIQQVNDRQDAVAIYQVFGPQKAPAAMAAYFGTEESEPDNDCAVARAGCEDTDDDEEQDEDDEDEVEETVEECIESDEEGSDHCQPITDSDPDDSHQDSIGSYVDIESLTIDLPRNWADLTLQERQDLNPYGCYDDTINPENGKCTEGDFSLYGWDGTPVRLTVALPINWQTLSEEEKEDYNPYGCYDYAQIRLSDGKCLSDAWALWGYLGDGPDESEEEYEEETDLYNSAKDIKLYVQTFKDAVAKEAYFTAGPEKHACSLVLDGTLSYIIEADLYIIYADAATLDDSFQPHQMQTLFQQFSPLDPQAVLRDSTDCQSRNDDLVSQQLLCQQSNSTEGNCAATGIDDDLLTAIEDIGTSCQLMYDNASASSDGIPTQADLADCLQLKDSIRQDFIDKTQIVDEDHEFYVFYRKNLGVYLPETKLPYTIWEGDPEQNLFVPEQQRYRFEMIALHEYLHKAYFEDLSLKERMRVHQEILALYEDNQQLFFDYYGTSALGDEIRFQIGRHGSASVLGVTNIIDDINSMAPQIRQTLPADIREEYSEFLDDRHGIVAFIYALAETQNNEWLGFLDFKDENLLKIDFNSQLSEIIEETYDQQTGGDEPLVGITFNAQLSQIFPGGQYNPEGWDLQASASKPASDNEDENEEDNPQDPEEIPTDEEKGLDSNATSMLYGIYWNLRGFFVEGYPIVALETTHPLSDWLQGHFDSRFDRTNLTHYFQYHPRLQLNSEANDDTNS